MSRIRFSRADVVQACVTASAVCLGGFVTVATMSACGVPFLQDSAVTPASRCPSSYGSMVGSVCEPFDHMGARRPVVDAGDDAAP